MIDLIRIGGYLLRTVKACGFEWGSIEQRALCCSCEYIVCNPTEVEKLDRFPDDVLCVPPPESNTAPLRVLDSSALNVFPMERSLKMVMTSFLKYFRT